MKKLPETEDSLLIRTDFSDDAAWDALCAKLDEPNADGNKSYLACINDPAYAGLTIEQLLKLTVGDESRTFAFIADKATFTDPERPILVVDLYVEPGRSFRVISREMSGIENNLSIGNMDYDDFAGAVDEDGVFRGLPQD